MNPAHSRVAELTAQIHTLEAELATALEARLDVGIEWVHGKARFLPHVLKEQATHRKHLLSYLRDARILVFLTAPVIYFCLFPFLFLDACVTFYQFVCFPVYGVPKVRRSDYLIYDRGNLKYLNLLERLNCFYCSYGNGVIAYVREVVGRTEQHWCPIKHARKMLASHSRYAHFLDYGEAREYRAEVETVRCDFGDVKPADAPKPNRRSFS
jgi:hypothetical protein